MSTILNVLRNKRRVVTASLFITAATSALAVYGGHYASITIPGSILAQAAVPVGVSTMQQMLLIIWSEVSGQQKPETSKSETSNVTTLERK